MSFLIKEDAIDRIVEVDFVEARSGVALEHVGVVVPEVEIAIVYAETGVVLAASDSEDLGTADLLAPYHLVGLDVDDPQLALAGAKD